jgi:hypothetical protein
MTFGVAPIDHHSGMSTRRILDRDFKYFSGTVLSEGHETLQKLITNSNYICLFMFVDCNVPVENDAEFSSIRQVEVIGMLSSRLN